MSRLLSARAAHPSNPRKMGRQEEIDALISDLLANSMELDDFLSRTDADEIVPERAFCSEGDLHTAIVVLLEVSKRYFTKSAQARSL